MPAGRPSKYDPAYCAELEAYMAEGFSLTAFAGKIGVNRATITNWMEQHSEFFAAATRGKALRAAFWEECAVKVAREGGGPGSATIIMFGLKNMAPDEWSDTRKIEHSGEVTHKREDLTDDELADIAGRGRGRIAKTEEGKETRH